jgi:ATP-dependent RNA helicase DeaD
MELANPSPKDAAAAPDTGANLDPILACEGFDQLGLAPAVLDTVQALGYELPTPIQCQCIPHLLSGRDLLGQAQTGTGKTAAFALPLISRVDMGLGPQPQVLVLTPTRELALQVAEAFQTYARGLRGFHVLPLYGGSSFGLQARQLERGVQVIVGTPGRVMDHLRRGTLDLKGLRALVLDEADEMLDMGFAEDIDWIFGQTPPERQVALFSATMPEAIRQVAHAHLRDPVEVCLAAATETVETVDQYHCLVTRFHKIDVLTRVLEVETFDAMLVFVRTKLQTLEVAEKLTAHGFNAEPLNGDMTQGERERTVERLKRGRLDILVATDVAARGLDLERLSLVVNYDMPMDPASYVHRIGRTGRAGREGRALMFVEPRERHLLKAIERTIRRRIPELPVPTPADLSAHRIERFSAQVTKTLAEADLDFFYRLVARIAREGELEAMDIAAALSFLAQRERPLQPSPEPEPAPKPKFKRREEKEARFERRERHPEERERYAEVGERYPQGRERYPEGRERAGSAERPLPRPERERPPHKPFQERPPRQERRQWVEGLDFMRPEDWRERLYQQEHHERSQWAEGDEEESYAPGNDYRERPERGEGEGRRPLRPRTERGQGFEGAPRPPRAEGQERPAARFGRPDRPERRQERQEPRFEAGFGRHGEGGHGEERARERDRDTGLVSYRIEVGRRDGVAPREIVGAIANEAGLEGRYIGRIDIEDDYSLVDLPEGMPREIFQHLRGVFVRGKRLNISLAGAGREREHGGPAKRPFKPREFHAGGGERGGERQPGPPRGFKPRRRPPES